MMNSENGRRPLATRSSAWVRVVAGWLTRARVSPNGISLAGLGFAAVAGFSLFATSAGSLPSWLALLLAAVGVQLRLLCNLLDGLVAVEGGVKAKAGALFNELPDRIEDTLLLAAAGHASGAIELGWTCAALALLTAYLRVLGTSLAQPADFRGPGAKPQRMFWLTVGCLASLLWSSALLWSLWIIAALTLLTAARRTIRLYRLLP